MNTKDVEKLLLKLIYQCIHHPKIESGSNPIINRVSQ